MDNLNYKPVAHDHQAFLARASKLKGFAEAYDALELEYQGMQERLKLLEDVDLAEVQMKTGKGIPHSEAKKMILKSLRK